MAPTIIDSDAVQGETFRPGQIFVFGGLALRANSLGHLEQNSTGLKDSTTKTHSTTRRSRGTLHCNGL